MRRLSLEHWSRWAFWLSKPELGACFRPETFIEDIPPPMSGLRLVQSSKFLQQIAEMMVNPGIRRITVHRTSRGSERFLQPLLLSEKETSVAIGLAPGLALLTTPFIS